jgi:hypothetical protein
MEGDRGAIPHGQGGDGTRWRGGPEAPWAVQAYWETPSVQQLALLSTEADRSPTDSLAQAITAVAALHADTCNLDHPGSPSATVAILHEQPKAIDYLVLGDTTILLEEPTGIRVLTDDCLEHVAAVQHRAMHQHATGSADHGRSFAALVAEQRRPGNHPDGFWWPAPTRPPPGMP